MGAASVLCRRAYDGAVFAWQLSRGRASQFGQDAWVVETLRGLRGGFFVDVGASDGWMFSNTYVLERRYGWSGVCIEANDRSFETLRRTRRCRCVHACLAETAKTVRFVEPAPTPRLFPGYYPALSGAYGGIEEHYAGSAREALSRSILRRQFLDARGALRTVEKRARPIGDVLRECGAPRVIHYLSLDTEGSELPILSAFPFDRHVVLALTVEHNGVAETREGIRSLLGDHGIERVVEGPVDDYYLRRDADAFLRATE